MSGTGDAATRIDAHVSRDDIATVVEAVERDTGHQGVTIVGLRNATPTLIFVVGDYRVDVVIETITHASSRAVIVSTSPVQGAWENASGKTLSEIDV